ncbi:MAG: Hsp20/alpha crystallin family protein [Planctomycetota bacterium]
MKLNKLVPWHWTGAKNNLPATRDEEFPILALQRNMNRMFEDFFTGFELEPFAALPNSGFYPAVNVTENDTAIEITAELPGLEENDIHLAIEQDVLTLSGEKKAEKEEKKENGYYRLERSYGSFRREIPLPTEVLADQAAAVFKKGVLHVTLPKKPEAQPHVKKIPVKTEEPT